MEKRFLLDALHEVNDARGYISSDDLRTIASRFNVSVGRLFAEVTWYDAFRTEKPGSCILRICDGTVCHARGNGSLLHEIETALGVGDGETTPDGLFTLHSVPCLGACEHAPVMGRGGRIFRTENAPLETVLATAAEPQPRLTEVTDHMRVLDAGYPPVLLREAKSLDSYLAHNGFAGLQRAISLPLRLDVIREVEASGLRGRSGSAFPVGLKWKSAFNAPGRDVNFTDRYCIINGDEGDPGAFMDRWLMEHTPYTVLEGLIIGAYALRATKGFIYIRDEYPAALKAMREAAEELRRNGFLGKDILGSGFSFDCQIVRAAESYLCGEESALMESIEGSPGIPRLRPPYPTARGLHNQPTVINNVETIANIPMILRDGGAAFAKTGTPSCTGTKIISLSGAVRNTGLAEIPLGALTLRQLVEVCGGGMREGAAFKCAQIGGPLGCLLTEEHLDTPLDFDSLKAAGGVLGSGGVIVMDQTMCAMETAQHLADFLAAESCGVCTPCREGLRSVRHILRRIRTGEASLADLPLLENLLETAQYAARCAFGQGFALPLSGSLAAFRPEYEEHILRHVCRAGKCSCGSRSANPQGGEACE